MIRTAGQSASPDTAARRRDAVMRLVAIEAQWWPTVRGYRELGRYRQRVDAPDPAAP